jgi:transcriptional regulator with XRE-family HTH domain
VKRPNLKRFLTSLDFKANECVEWSADLADVLSKSYGGTLIKLSSKLGSKTNVSQIRKLAKGDTVAPTLKTLQAWANVFDQPIIILPEGRKKNNDNKQ